MPVGSLLTAKESAFTYQPLLLAVVTFSDGTVFRLASHEVTYGGNAYAARLLNKDIAATQALSDQGIDIPASVTLRIADADYFIWGNYETNKGFKGSKLTLTAVLYDVVANEFSSDERVIFKGICRQPGGQLPSHDGKIFTVGYFSRLGLADLSLPSIRIQRTCPWTFPATLAQRQAGADDPFSEFHQCGYSPDATGGEARGNLNGGSAFTTCDFTKDACVARGMYSTDSSSRVTARFGGVQWSPPTSVTVKSYGGKYQTLDNPGNEAKYGDYVPLLFGRFLTDPPVITMAVDGNYLKIEALICYGAVDSIYDVTVNDVWVPHGPDDAQMPELGAVSRSDALKGGWWKCSSRGYRSGAPTNDAGFNDEAGTPQGDPHGSMCVIEIVVPRKVADAGSVPRVRVLATRGTSNPAEHLKEIFQLWVGWPAAEFDEASFDTVATYNDVVLNYTNQWGASAARWRFTSALYLRQRESAADVIRGMRNSMRAILGPDTTGKLRLRTKRTLAGQQPATVSGSNYNTAVTSKLEDGSTANGYVAYRFDEGNMEAPTPGTLTAGNVFQIAFANAENRHSIDSYNPIDSEDIQRSDQEIPGSFLVRGADNYGQLQRLMAAHLAEQMRGNWRGDTAGTLALEIVTNFRAIHLAVGDIVMVNWQLLGLSNQLMRVQRIQPDHNFAKTRITATWHSDDWYVDTYGQRAIPRPNSAHRNRLERPSFAWLPAGETPATNNVLYGATDLSFYLAQTYERAADGSAIAKLDVWGKTPVNITTANPNPPALPVQGTTANTGGSIAGGRAYYVAIAATNSAGKLSALSPIAVVEVPTGTNTNTIGVNDLHWDTGATGYVAYAGTNPQALSKQAEASGTPTSITLTALNVATLGAPDQEFDSFRARAKRVVHSGCWGTQVVAVTSTTIQVAVVGAGFTTNQWNGYTVSWLGAIRSTEALPIADWRVLSNTSDTLILDAGPNPVTIGVEPGDVVVMRSKATAGTDGAGDYVTDPNWANVFAPTGLAADVEEGNILRVIAGTGRGLTARIKGNTGTKIYVDLPFTWDSTTRYIVEEPTWAVEQDSGQIDNDNPDADTSLQIDVNNYRGAVMLVQVLTMDGGGNEAVDALSPIREIYVFGEQENIVTVDADYTVSGEDQNVLVDTTAGDVNIELIPSDAMRGPSLLVKKISTDSNEVTITAAGGEDIDGAATVTLTAQWAFWIGKKRSA